MRDFARWPSMTVMTPRSKRHSWFRIHRTLLHVHRLEGWHGGWEGVTWIWRGIGVRWYTSKITRGLKEGRKKGRFIRALRRRMFPIFPDFTAGMMCVMKYAGTMLCRKGAITLWKSAGTIFLRKHARQCPNPRYTLSYITGWYWIELVGSWPSSGLPVSLSLPLQMLWKICLFSPLFILYTYVLLFSSWWSILWCKYPTLRYQCGEHHDFGRRRRIFDWLGYVCHIGAQLLGRVERTVDSCICSKIDLLLISVFIGNMAIHVGISPPE